MPTNMRRETGSFSGVSTVLASEIGLRSPRMLTLDESYLGGDGFVIKPGSIVCKLGSGLGRVYPAAKATAATTTSSAVLTVDDPTVFKVGDVLINAADDALGTISSIDLEAKTITLGANTVTAVANGDQILGNAATVGTPYGMVVSQFAVKTESNDVAAYTSCSVFEARLPYWSDALQAAFPEITTVGA